VHDARAAACVLAKSTREGKPEPWTKAPYQSVRVEGVSFKAGKGGTKGESNNSGRKDKLEGGFLFQLIVGVMKEEKGTS